MIYVLLVVLFLILAIELYLNKWSVLAPGCVTVEVFIVSTLFVIPNLVTFGDFVLEKNTFFIIVCGIIAFCVGERLLNILFDKELVRKIPLAKKYFLDPDLEDKIPWLAVVICSAVLAISIVLRYQKTCELARISGSPNGIRETIKMAKIITNQPGNHYGRTLNLLGMLGDACFLVFGYIAAKHVVCRSFKWIDVIYFIPIVLSIVTKSVVPGRLQYISMIVAALMMIYALYVSNHGMTIKSMICFIGIAAGCLLLFFGVFILMGGLGKNDSFFTISKYTAGSIYSLNEYLNREVPVVAGRFGQETLYGVYNLLGHFVDGIEDIAPHLEFSGIKCNVYTAYRRLYHDYGFCGLIVLEIIFGAFYSCIYRYASTRFTSPLWVIAWGYVAQALVHQSIDDLLMTELLSSQTLYVAVLVVLIILFIQFQNTINRKLYKAKEY